MINNMGIIHIHTTCLLDRVSVASTFLGGVWLARASCMAYFFVCLGFFDCFWFLCCRVGACRQVLRNLESCLSFCPEPSSAAPLKSVHWCPFSQFISLGHDCVFGLHPELHVAQQCVEKADHCSGVSAHRSCGVSLELNFQTQSDGHHKSCLLAWESLLRWSSLPSPVSGDSLLCFPPSWFYFLSLQICAN